VVFVFVQQPTDESVGFRRQVIPRAGASKLGIVEDGKEVLRIEGAG